MHRPYRVVFVALTVLCLGLAPLACGGGGEDETEPASRIEGDSEVVATYGDKQLTLEEFTIEADKLPPQVKPMLSSPDRRRQYLENLIVSRLLVEDARSKGLNEQEDIRKQVKEMENRLLLQKVYKDLQAAVTVTDEDVAAEYNANPEAYSTAEIRTSHILVEDPATAREVLAKVEKNPDAFADLAKQYSKDTATAAKGGDLGFFGRGRMVPDFEEAAFALETPGEISEIVKSPFGYHIIKLTEKKAGETKPLDQVKEQIRLSLLQKRQRESMEAHIDALKTAKGVQINDDVLAKYSTDPPAAPSVLPPGTLHGGAAGGAGASGSAGDQ